MGAIFALPDAPGRFGNLLLDGLGQGALATLLPSMKPVQFRRGQNLARRGKPLRRLVFPITSILALEERVGHARIEVMTVGNEGLVGYWLAMPSDPVDVAIACMVPGLAVEIQARAFASALVQRPELFALASQMAHSTAVQLMRNVVCVTVHPLRERCARLLLEVAVRLGDSFQLTHEELATALSATRPSVTREMHELATARVIEYRRGIVRVLDEARLVGSACSCVETLISRRRQLAGAMRRASRPGRAVPGPELQPGRPRLP